ncbi:tryptophan--tRNA ligase [Clostridium cylindrosporum]|uniref:Tryptophan--tRNA ligase n=1 Tax=Clostridium cylindrosporum DSM 605 TaxID=1121307 RepID=A0A0J8G4I4_CLOCY|nr:tryptophan--tRNA ligase [Clostridium cylindrosporum]KMT22581.1 tryptophan--tRNA ligase TrpS [Clostridium cylindrosporum DSM 605]
MESKKVIFSGTQPSGKLTLGNYLGALKNWVDLQDDYNCYYCIVDLHAITVPQEPKDLRARTLEVLAQYIASGIDPEKNTLFIQSHVTAHAELAWVLNCLTYMGELNRMTQYKEKSSKVGANLNAGLFTYPSLMAADILLYGSDLVPVGEDQKQHLELARDLAARFNTKYSETFKVPEPYIPKVGARIMSLQEPTKKMSKSDDNKNAFILLSETADETRSKVRKAVTDSIGEVNYSDDQPGIKNLLTMYSIFTGESIESIVDRYKGEGYGKFKEDTAEAIIEGLRPLREKYNYLMSNKDYLENIYTDGAKKAEYAARKMLRKVYKKVGFIPRKFD